MEMKRTTTKRQYKNVKHMAGLRVLNRLPCHLYTHTHLMLYPLQQWNTIVVLSLRALFPNHRLKQLSAAVVPTAAVERYHCLIFISFISKQSSQTPHSQCTVKPTITQADIHQWWGRLKKSFNNKTQTIQSLQLNEKPNSKKHTMDNRFKWCIQFVCHLEIKFPTVVLVSHFSLSQTKIRVH